MSIFDNDPKDFILISHVPPLVQENGEKINPRAEAYIHGGEVCEFDEWGRAEYVYAAVANINGKDIFFLFNAES